jgi:hypothetical protein
MPLEKVPPLFAKPFKTFEKRAQQPMHTCHQARLRGLHGQMKVISRRHVRIQSPPMHLAAFSEALLERALCSGRLKNIPPVIPAV